MKDLAKMVVSVAITSIVGALCQKGVDHLFKYKSTVTSPNVFSGKQNPGNKTVKLRKTKDGKIDKGFGGSKEIPRTKDGNAKGRGYLAGIFAGLSNGESIEVEIK